MSSPKSAQVIQTVKDMIIRGDLKPGDRLPNEDEFALQLGLSRNSMREAVRALSAMQILVSRQGDGTYVSSLEPQQLLETLSFAVDIAGVDSVLDFLHVRRVLESQATMLAAARHTDNDLIQLRRIHNSSLEETNADRLMELDLEFHRTIAVLAGNPVLTSLLGVVSNPTVRARMWRGRSEDIASEILRREHGLILSAIERRDPQSANVEAYNHVMGVERWVRANLAAAENAPKA
jgi:GntR family transcriptional repressor for pyruvate dehydrogenase complex